VSQTDEQLWREARERLLALDAVWSDVSARRRGLEACRAWLAARREQPRLSALARLLTPDMTRAQFWCALVPVEREVVRARVTDIEILDRDLAAESAPAAPPMPLTVVADSLRSAFNVGGIFRTAECFGVAEVLLCGYTPAPDRPQAARAALGAEKLVPWRTAGDVRAALTGLKDDGVRCVALETVAGAKSLERAEWAFPCALVLGNERFGLNADVIGLCDEVVRIPLCGRKNSLNVVSAFALAAHAARQRFDAGRGA
jgi:tRNA G18 (ribose-2'-O)-methylase SpoU